jgi:hypothetical protein
MMGQAMGTKPQIGVEEYLVLPHRDRVLGRLLPRVRLTLMTELRVQIEPNLFRVVDFAVYRGRTAQRYPITLIVGANLTGSQVVAGTPSIRPAPLKLL